MFLIILNIILFVLLIIVTTFLVVTIRSNFTLQQQIDQYEDFFLKISSILEDDIVFLKGKLAKSFSESVPEVAEFSRGLTRFANHIKAIQSNIRLFGLVEQRQLEKLKEKDTNG